MKSGTIIQLSEEGLNLLVSYQDALELQSYALEKLFRMMRESERRFFAQIRELHPELAQYHFSIDYEKGEITTMYKKDKAETQ